MKKCIFCLLMLLATAYAQAQTVVAEQGAWCWFADPRALHNGDYTYLGYIDVHGNVCATQLNERTGERTEVLIRSCFQPDDHNNPTFQVLPDGRVMIFYTRHTDEPRIWYRISKRAGDISDLGKEKFIQTKHNTTYPSPFIMSDDPQHIYLCWRGIGWHPTIARITLPDAEDSVTVDYGPKQIVQSTGARPYAKYYSNGRDKIYLAYTTGHPDNEWPNWLYFNVVDINHGNGPILRTLHGEPLSIIADGPFHVSKRPIYQQTFPTTIIDAPRNSRCWLWQIALDKQERPVVAMVHIDSLKTAHEYLYAHWTGTDWRLTDLGSGGHAFHQNWNRTERCYSGGMAIDQEQPETVYLSMPVGDTYEIVRLKIDPQTGSVASREAVTTHSPKNNCRPFVVNGQPYWMQGDYYYWMVNKSYPEGYPTKLMTTKLPMKSAAKKTIATIKGDGKEAKPGTTIFSKGKRMTLRLNEHNRLELTIKGKTYTSECLFLSSDAWAANSVGTNGDSWPTPLTRFTLTIQTDGQHVILLRDGKVEMIIE